MIEVSHLRNMSTGLRRAVIVSAEESLKIAAEVEHLVYQFYQQENMQPEFPIDLGIITEHLGIVVEYESLNMGSMDQISRTLAILTKQNKITHILVDNSVSYKTQRYAIANAIGRFLMSEAVFESSYAIPLIPQSLEEIAADIIALYLLMPMTLFKDEFKGYLERANDHPLDVDMWLQYLSDRSQISPFNLAIGYQQMKQVLCYQRQKKFEECGFDITKMEDDRYGMIFA